MAQKKEESKSNKPRVKIQDLSPKKDAKGGAARNSNAGGGDQNALRGADSARGQNALRGADGVKGSN